MAWYYGNIGGIDLLGKFNEGNDYYGKVSERFISFLKYFGNISQKEKEVIYQLQNSLLHSFVLYSKDKKGNVYKFTLGKSFPQFILQKGNSYFVNVLELRKYFDLSIENYYKALKNDTNLQLKFEKMFQRYGAIHMT